MDVVTGRELKVHENSINIAGAFGNPLAFVAGGGHASTDSVALSKFRVNPRHPSGVGW